MQPEIQIADPDRFAKAFAEALAKGLKDATPAFKALSGAAQGPYSHGPGGLFGVRGLSRGIISTLTQITGSIGARIPVKSSGPYAEQNPLFAYITGVNRSDTQEKNAICDDPEEAGNFLTCLQTTFWGRKEFKSRELVVTELNNTINRGEFMDLVLENQPLINQMGGLMRDFAGVSGAGNALLAGKEIVLRMAEMGYAFQRWFCATTFTGNPSNSKAGGGYREFMGLDMLIGTNKIDAMTGQACTGLYSDVKSFGYRQIDSTTDPDIQRVLSTMMYILETRAIQNNLDPVKFVIGMRSQLFWELTRVWPLLYYSDKAGLSAAGLDNLYLEMIRMRDAMREGRYLIINGRQYEVWLDDCILEENKSVVSSLPTSGFASDIYILPVTAMGGQLDTLYWQYKDFNETVMPQLNRLPAYWWSDGGQFLWTMSPPQNWCMDVKAVTIPRMILRTPQLAGRLTDVVYVPLQHTNDPLPSQYYHVNGGVGGRPFASPYSEWNPAGPGVQA